MTRPSVVRPVPRSADANRTLTPRDMLAGLAALLGLVVVLAGVPLLLLAVAGSPIPGHWPSATEVGQALLSPDDGRLLAAVLAILAWLGWAAVAESVGVEAAAYARGRAARRLPGLGPIQLVTARLVAAAAVVLCAPTAPMFGAAAAMANTPSVSLAAAPVAQRAVAAVDGMSPALTIPETGTAVATETAPPSPAPEHVYEVRPLHDGHRDTLWSIAAEHLGDPLRWPEIAELNRGRPQPDGGKLLDPHWIRPGWRLVLPIDATGLTPRQEPASSTPAAAGPAPEKVFTPPQEAPDRSAAEVTSDCRLASSRRRILASRGRANSNVSQRAVYCF